MQMLPALILYLHRKDIALGLPRPGKLTMELVYHYKRIQREYYKEIGTQVMAGLLQVELDRVIGLGMKLIESDNPDLERITSLRKRAESIVKTMENLANG